MIFYTIHPRPDDDVIVDWAGTQADARAACKAWNTAHPGGKSSWKEHDVPTDKAGLLAWLKKHAVSLGELQVELIAEALHRTTSDPQQL